MLALVARLEVASVEALQCAFALSRSVMYSHLRRLTEAAMVLRLRGYGHGGAVAITRQGRRSLALPAADAPAGTQHGLGMRHGLAVSWVAALLELRDRAWVSDSELRQRPDWRVQVIWPGSRSTHRPDLGATIGDARVAIEFERTQKRARRLRAILAGYEDAIASAELSGVLYVYEHPAVARLVQREAAVVGLAEPHIRLRQLGDVIAEARALAGLRSGQQRARLVRTGHRRADFLAFPVAEDPSGTTATLPLSGRHDD